MAEKNKLGPININITTDRKKKTNIFAGPDPSLIGEPSSTVKPSKPLINEIPHEEKPTIDLDKTYRPQDESMRSYYEHQKKDYKGTYTMIPNSLMDMLPRYNLNKTAQRILWLILRKTLGFHTNDAPISIDYMRKCTGISNKTNVINGLRQIEQANLVTTYYDKISKNKHVVLNEEIFTEFKNLKGSKKSKEEKVKSGSQKSTSTKKEPVLKQDQSFYDTGPDLGQVQNFEDLVPKNQDLVHSLAPNKEIKNNFKEIFLSLEQANGISRFFLREREISKNIIEGQLQKEYEQYKQLNKSHTNQEIEDLLDYLEKNGGVGAQYEGQKIRFPFKYLNSGGLDAVVSKIETIKKLKQDKELKLIKEKQKYEEDKAMDLIRIKYRYFQLKYPDKTKQTKILENIIKTELDNATKKKLKNNDIALRVAAKELWIENNFTMEKYNKILEEKSPDVQSRVY